MSRGYGGGATSTFSSPTPPTQRPNPKPAARTKPTPKPKSQTQAISGPVALVSVGDGDTIRVTGANGQKVTIRMACIDARETAQGESGAVATQTPKQLLASGLLEIKPQTVDRYGCTVAEVYAGGRNVNLEMVRRGAAYAYRQYLSGCDVHRIQ